MVNVDLSSESDDDSNDNDSDAQNKLKHFTEPGQLNDPVKLYLKEIGRIPLLNKETEKVIAQTIKESKEHSVDAVVRFPFVAKELIGSRERVEKDPLVLKDIIQFSSFDEDNLPMIEEERDRFFASIDNAEKISEMKKKFIVHIVASLLLLRKSKKCLMQLKPTGRH